MSSICDCLYGPKPFQKGSEKGSNSSIAKHLAIGIIVAAALAVGVYFAGMEMYKVWNPFNVSLATQMGCTIAGSCIVGLMVLFITGLFVNEDLHDKAKRRV